MSASKIAGSITPGQERSGEGRVAETLVEHGRRWAIVITHREDGGLAVASSGKNDKDKLFSAALAEGVAKAFLAHSKKGNTPA